MKSRLLRLLFLSVPLFCVATVIVSPAQTLTVLAAFNGFNGGLPTATVVQGTDGNFYGTTNWGEGSSNGHGNVFSVTPSGDLTIVYSFCSLPNCADGAFPAAGLVQGSDENFYGTTTEGGALNAGTLFKVTPSGTFTTLHSFCSFQNCADGGSPYGTLVQGSDGDFYGTTNTGGINEGGTIFKITPGGTLTTIYSFCSLAGCADGAATYSGLVQGEDGNFYGTTYGGGYRSLYGTVFKVTSTGTLTTLYEFCTQPNCADGDFPLAALVQGTDGNFYGTTSEGGNQNCGGYGCGTVFKITPSGTLTTIYDLCSQANCADGANPWALVQATDGSFYGTTRTGGAQNDGVVFQVASGGDLMSAYSVCSQDDCVGGQPMAGVIQGTDGNFYGTIYSGGSGGYGSVFRLSVGIALSPVQFVPVAPCRLVDTRQTYQPIQSGTFQFFNIPELGDCSIPATSAAYSLNVTVVPHQPLGYLTIWPAGRPQPTVSTMNSPDGRVKANAAIVPVGANDEVSIYATDTTDVILDIDGYFTAPSSQTYEFYPVTPCRVVDTRSGSGFPRPWDRRRCRRSSNASCRF